jgi:hypothetical protein
MIEMKRMAIVVALLLGSHVAAAQSTAPPKVEVRDSKPIEADFSRRVDDYVKLHKQLEAMLPKLPKEATPQQIDQEQRALLQLVARARANARPGDLFTPDMQTIIKQRFAVIFQGRRGQETKKYIHDEPHPVTPEINKRYPDNVPLSTMPPRVLAQLPKLPDELEYRFVANHLILMDVHAHIILDYMLNAIPADPAAAADKKE